MCLILTVTAPAGDREKLEAVARDTASTALRIQVEHPPRWPWARDRPVRAFISEDGGCACSLLSDDADWNADAWKMRPDVLDRLAGTIETLAAAVPEGLIIEALWVGDAPIQTIQIGAKQLAALARSSLLGTRSRYEVREALR